jgi:HD-GYP domain-containing protein (c-di-GMP phosphodiesterase class II)
MGAWLHDIGKLAIPDSILLKPGPLNEQERQIMQRHVELGYDLVRGIPFLADAAEVILAHHERYNGSGYPRGLLRDNIPMCARIFAVADSFDAMTSDRPYRSALPFHAALAEIGSGRRELFDPRIVDAFLAVNESAWKQMCADAQTTPMRTIMSGKVAPLTSLEKVAN